MIKKRRSYSPEFKFRIALEALKGMETIAQMAQTHQVHPNQVRAWSFTPPALLHLQRANTRLQRTG